MPWRGAGLPAVQGVQQFERCCRNRSTPAGVDRNEESRWRSSSGHQGDRGRKSRDDPDLGRSEPGDTGDGGARRAGPGSAGQDPGAGGLLGAAGHLGPSAELHADQAGAGPLRQGRRRPRAQAGRAPARRRLRLRGGPAADRRSPPGRRAGRCHRRLQGQGLRRRDEAPQLQGPGRLPREPQEAPVTRVDRRLRHPVPGLQGNPDGRTDGWPAGDHPQSRDRPGRLGAGADPGQGSGARPTGRDRGPAGRHQGAVWSRGARPDECRPTPSP